MKLKKKGMNQNQTIREIIAEFQREVRDTDLLPQRAASILSKLSALMGNVNDEIRKRDLEYSLVLLKELESEEKANRAKIRAECSKEYQDKRQARDTKDLVVEMIGSLKYFLRSKEEEYKLYK